MEGPLIGPPAEPGAPGDAPHAELLGWRRENNTLIVTVSNGEVFELAASAAPASRITVSPSQAVVGPVMVGGATRHLAVRKSPSAIPSHGMRRHGPC